jgi:hypothetical protein
VRECARTCARARGRERASPSPRREYASLGRARGRRGAAVDAARNKWNSRDRRGVRALCVCVCAWGGVGGSPASRTYAVRRYARLGGAACGRVWVWGSRPTGRAVEYMRARPVLIRTRRTASEQHTKPPSAPTALLSVPTCCPPTGMLTVSFNPAPPNPVLPSARGEEGALHYRQLGLAGLARVSPTVSPGRGLATVHRPERPPCPSRPPLPLPPHPATRTHAPRVISSTQSVARVFCGGGWGACELGNAARRG